MKKMLAILLAAVMIFSLATCGTTAPKETEADTPAATEKAEEAEGQAGGRAGVLFESLLFLI